MKMNWLVAIVVGACSTFSACTMTPPAQKRLAAYNEADFAPYAANGTSTITGQAFLKTRGGEVRFGAGNEVVLAPVTPYTEEIHNRNVMKYINLGKPDDGYYRYRKTVRADGNGNFEFKNLPPGEYFVWCDITWETGGAYTPGLVQTGATAYARVKVGQGETVKAIVTR